MVDRKTRTHAAACTFTPRAGGDPVTTEGRYTDMSQRIEGSWRYVFDHVSVPLPPSQ